MYDPLAPPFSQSSASWALACMADKLTPTFPDGLFIRVKFNANTPKNTISARLSPAVFKILFFISVVFLKMQNNFKNNSRVTHGLELRCFP
jgi:hypothetical protein